MFYPFYSPSIVFRLQIDQGFIASMSNVSVLYAHQHYGMGCIFLKYHFKDCAVCINCVVRVQTLSIKLLIGLQTWLKMK